MLRLIGFATTFLFATGLATSAAAQVKLEYKFPDDETSTTVTQVKTRQILSLAGQDISTSSDQTMTIASVSGRRAPNGTLKVHQKMAAMQATVSLPGDIQLNFDSQNPDAEPPGTPFDFVLDIFKVLAQSEWNTVYAGNHRVVSIEGREKALESLDEPVRKMIRKQLDPEYLKQVANDELDKIPNGPVSPGDTWERTQTIRLDSGQLLTLVTRYAYQGITQQGGKQLDQIGARTTKVTYSADDDAPLKVVESDLAIEASEGGILFDRQLGQVVMGRSNVQIKGGIKIDVNGMELAGTLDLTMEQTTTRK